MLTLESDPTPNPPGVDLRGVHEAPAIVNGDTVQKPTNLGCAAPGNTVAHFGDLLGYVDMDRRSAGERDDLCNSWGH